MSKNINQKLRSVDNRIAGIDRRLGFLQGQVFFRPYSASTPTLVDIFDFKDQGITPMNITTGEQLSAHRYSVRVSRDWMDANAGISGRWYIQRSPSDPLLLCEKEDESTQDADTFSVIRLRVSQEVSIG
ncbi:MAG: hypothetical protein NVS2B14_14560 [Chamaesiphon sp.]